MQKMSLESGIQCLQQKLEEAEEALQKAAQYGLQLLNDKVDLQNKLEEQRIEMTAIIEGLEQEKYSLHREVELKGRILDSLRSEFDIVKSQQKGLLEQQQAMLERNKATEIKGLKTEMEKMKGDLEEAELLNKQLRHKLELQSCTLSSKTEELRKLTECASETMSSEILELQVHKMDLESSMALLEQEHQELQYKEQQLQLANCILQRQLETLTNTREEKEKEAASIYIALEKSREANQDLQIQLDQILQQAQDPNSKGNSLFSEVEDKRAETERQLISMKVQFQSLQKQHAFSKQQMLRMKVQISNLMHLQGTRADPAQLERLQFMLSEKNSEIEALMSKVQQLEKKTTENQSSTAYSKEIDFVDETYYTDLLKMQLSNSKKAAEKLKNELSMARMKALSESQRVLELERKVFAAENALKQRQSDSIKLQVKIEELQMKYESNEVNKEHTQKCKREKILVNLTKEGTDSTERRTLDKDVDTLPCLSENRDLTSPQPPQALDCNSALPCDAKSVNISQVEAISVPVPPRCLVEDCSSKQKMVTWAQEGDNWIADRRKNHEAPVYIDKENTMERQCAQQ
ncbi:protein Spindly [Trichomycterus rosablanca]|uniref:protein Spindly n=1 Tax=Trichomycterus rosablanca TaxID=2290929 RepID=UPI002F35DC36